MIFYQGQKDVDADSEVYLTHIDRKPVQVIFGEKFKAKAISDVVFVDLGKREFDVIEDLRWKIDDVASEKGIVDILRLTLTSERFKGN